MGKAGGDISKSFEGPQAALEALNAKTVETSNTVAESLAKLEALRDKSTRASETRANVEATQAEKQVAAAEAVETAELKLEATRVRNFATEEARIAAMAAARARLDAAEFKEGQVARDASIAKAAALDAEVAATGRATKAEADLAAARDLNTAAIARQDEAMVASSGVLARYGGAIGAVGMAATAAFAVMGAVGVEAATKFETGMMRIQVAGQVSQQQTQALSQGLLDMSTQMGVSMNKLQEASLMIAKAGPQYKDAAENLNILRSGIELSKTEGADLTTVVQQMTTSMTDFSMGAGSAADVATKFQMAAANAKRPLEEFVGALHNIEPAAMGVLDNKTGLNQVLTVMSQMAGTGAGIDQASQNLNNFLSHLNAPNAPQRSVLGSLGLDSTVLSQQLKAPNGLITVLGELREAMAKVTTGTGENAVTHLGEAFKNPQITKLMGDDYAKLSDFQKNLADRFTSANQAGIPVDKDTMRQMRAAAGTSGLLKDWYTKFLQTTGPSNLVKQGINPDMSPAMALQLATGSQAGDRSMLGIVGDPGNPNDPHWANTQKTLTDVSQAHANGAGDIPGWDIVKDTAKQKLDEFEASFKKLAIEVGTDILPVFKVFIGALTDMAQIFTEHKTLVDILVVSLGAMATAWTGIKVAMAFQGVFNMMANGIDLAIGKFGLLKTAAAESATAIETTGTASTKAAAETEVATTAEVAAEGRVKTAAGEAAVATESVGRGVLLAIGSVVALPAAVGAFLKWGNDKYQHDDPDGIQRTTTDQIAHGRAGGHGGSLDEAHTPNSAAAPNATGSPSLGRHGRAPLGHDTGVNIPGMIPGTAIPLPPGSETPLPSAAPNDTPAGTSSDPVQVEIPGFDPSSLSPSSFSPSDFGSSTADDMGIGDMSGGMGGMGGAITNPLEQLKGGGFSLANIAKVMTTFLMELALGNPLGHLLTGTGMDGSPQGGGDPTAQLGDIDKMTTGQRKQAEDELAIQSALAKYKAAQANYIKIIGKYGSGSPEGLSAYSRLLSAKDNVEGVELRQTDQIATGNAALQAAQATVAQDKTDRLDVSDPAKYQADVAKANKIQNSLPTGNNPGGGPTVNPGKGAEGWRGTVADTVAKYGAAAGIPPSQYGNWTDAIVRQIDTESHGNPGADNPNDPNGRGGTQHVSGLLQYLPSTFANSAQKLTGVTDMMNPVAQIAGALLAGKNAAGAPTDIGNGVGWGPSRQPVDTSLVQQSAPVQAPAAPGSPGGGAPAGGGSILGQLLQQFLPGAGPGSQSPIFKRSPPPGSPNPSGPFDNSPAAVKAREAADPAFQHLIGHDVNQQGGPRTPGPITPPGGVAAPPGARDGMQVVGSPTAPTQYKTAAPGGGGGVGASRGPVPGAISNPGAPPPSNTAKTNDTGSGSGVSVGGGMLGTAESLASTALNAIAPGAGIAAQIGMQELNNVASYVGKAAGIAVEGAQETFSLHSPDGDGPKDSGGWLGKIAGGLAGGHPQAPNSAGTATAAPVQPQNPQQQNSQAGAQGTTNNYNVTNNNHGVNDAQGVATKTNQSLMQYPTTP